MTTVAELQAPDAPTTLSVLEAGAILGLSHNHAYESARRGEIPVLRFGRCLRVPVPALLKMLGAEA